MIVKEKFCEEYASRPDLFADLLKNVMCRPNTLELNLKRKSKKLRGTIAFAETLRQRGLSDEEIFEPNEVFENA